MKRHISPRDWELLSEYLDRQLSSKKQVHLEARLEANPDLRAALDDLRQTRAILRSTPKLKAPHSFTLKPSMVPQRKAKPIYPVFQMASAVATLMLVLVLFGDLMGFGIPQAMTQKSASYDMAAEALVVEPTAETMVEGEQMRAMGVPEAESALQSAPLPNALESPAPGAFNAVPTPTSTLKQAPPSLMAEPTAATEANQILEMQQVDPADSEDAFIEQGPPSAPRVSTWRAIEILLALVALTTGLAALYIKRTVS